MRVPHQKASESKTNRGRGAPIGNRNALKTGMRSDKRRNIQTFKLPSRLKWAERRKNHFRRSVEQVVLDVKGEITLIDGALVNSATRWELHAMLCGHWLSKELDRLTPEQRIAYSREVARASAERDKCLKQLGIEHKEDVPALKDYLDGSIKE